MRAAKITLHLLPFSVWCPGYNQDKHFGCSTALCIYEVQCVNWRHCGGLMAVGICLVLACESVMWFKARFHADSLRAASASGKWIWPVATALQSTYCLTRIVPTRVADRAALLACCRSHIYEQACRTPWQHLLAHSAASVMVRVPLPFLRVCFQLLFHWKWCPSGVVRMSSRFWMCMRIINETDSLMPQVIP